MARRRNRAERQRQQGAGQPAALTVAHLDFISDRVFDPPLTGIYNGQIVKVHERGNSTGMSATFWITDNAGRNLIASLGTVTMLDANYIAPTNEQLDTVLDGLEAPAA